MNFLSPLGLPHSLLLSLLVFALGLYGMLAARNSLRLLMAAQLMVLAGALCLTAFSEYLGPASLSGQALAVFSILGAIALLLAGAARISPNRLETIAIKNENQRQNDADRGD